MKWVLIFYIVGAQQGFSGSIPTESLSECVGQSVVKVSEFIRKYGEPTLVSFICNPRED